MHGKSALGNLALTVLHAPYNTVKDTAKTPLTIFLVPCKTVKAPLTVFHVPCMTVKAPLTVLHVSNLLDSGC